MEGALRSGERAAETLLLKACGLLDVPAPTAPSRPPQKPAPKPSSPPLVARAAPTRETAAFEHESGISLQQQSSPGDPGEAESPFLHQELFAKGSEELEPRAAALVAESPFAGELHVRPIGFDEELTEGEALDELEDDEAELDEGEALDELDEREELEELEAERIWEELEEEQQSPLTARPRLPQFRARTTPPSPDEETTATNCGFYAPKKVVSLGDVRKAIVDAAVDERKKWFVKDSLQLEDMPERHGDLVRYFIAGNKGSEVIQPDTLLAAMQAVSAVSSYAELRDKDTDDLVSEFAKLEKAVNDATKDLLKKWDDFDLHSEQVSKATDAANLAEAKKAVEADKLARDRARAKRTNAVRAREKFSPKAGKLKPANVQRVLDELRKIIKDKWPTGVPKLAARTFEDAILAAHRSRSDIEAWSAVFISTVVRLGAIAQGLEIKDSKSHRKKKFLLLVSNRHWEYFKEARRRADEGENGGYHAFPVAGRAIQEGDIIVQDRRAELERAVAFSDKREKLETHGDIVTGIVEDGKYAEAIGGNVGHSVRRRRFPLNDRGHLITARQQRFLQEGDDGTFTVLAPLPRNPSRLPLDSMARIFAVLSLVEECRPIPAGEAEWTASDRLGHVSNEDYEDLFRGQTEEEQDAALALENGDGATGEPREWWLGDEPQPFAGFETEADEERGFEDREDEAYLEEEWKDLAAAETIDAECAQPLYAQAVRDRLEPLLEAKRVRAASAWNTAWHPGKSEVSTTALAARLGQYLNRPAIETAMRNSAELKNLAGDAGAVLAVMTHQFQQKIYFAGTAKECEARHDGRLGEGTLDALGFVRHRGRGLNTVDRLNVDYHVTGKSKAFKRVQQAHQDDPRLFDTLGTDVNAKTWYYLFVNGPFLGRPFTRGIQVELMWRLRKAERWLCVQPQYRGLSPVELGAALGIDEDHSGGRTTTNSSMHTLGLAVDIGYTKNPWVAGQHGPTGTPNTTRNTAFKAVTRNVSRLMTGTDEVLTPQWLASLSSAAGQTTAWAYDEIQRCHANLRDYLSLERDPVRLTTLIQQRSRGAHPEWVIRRGETVDDAVTSWRRRIALDRVSLRTHLPRSNPGLGFLNHHRDLVIALRDHGCLAWGAIDLGRNANGDMMHFDCRATGIGWTLALERQRTTGVSHRCHTTATTQEVESRTAPATFTTSPEISEELDLDETFPGDEDELLSWVLTDQEHEEEGIPITPTGHRESPFRDEEIQGIEPEADEELEVEDEFDAEDFDADEFEAGEFEAEDVEAEQLEEDDEAFEGESFDDQDEGELEVVEECEDAFGDGGESEEPATDYQAGEWDAG